MTRPLAAAALLAGTLLLLPSLRAQTGGTSPHVLRVAAAADLEPLLPSVLQQFEQQAGVHAVVTYQSSATLAQQIIGGAPFDLFMAADLGFPQRVVDAGLATEARPVPYARGTLVVWARKDAAVLHGKPLTPDTLLSVLNDSALQSVAIANPDHAPYGRAARAAIASLHLQEKLAPKLRVAANIAQTAQYADSGNAEIGFLSLTGASTSRLVADGSYTPVPASAYPPIVQGAVVIRGGDAADAERFLQFLASPAARAQLRNGGLLPPD